MRHLKLLPPATGHRPLERLDSAALLARAGDRGDCEKTIARLTLEIARQADTIADLGERVADLAEERDDWRRRALDAEARLRRPSVWAAWWALLALGWQAAWQVFEEPGGDDREGKGGA